VFQHRFDQILGPLSERFFREADAILDLRGAALNRLHPAAAFSVILSFAAPLT
jgi:hypothetical protein